MFAYCGNAPVGNEDPKGTILWHVTVDGEEQEDEARRVIKYSVPLYRQGNHPNCWAICMIIRKSYDEGTKLSDEEVLEESIALGKRYHPILSWDQGLPFSRQGKKIICRNIDDLYFILQMYGPVYAAYRKNTIFGGHIVIVTGVDLDRGYIYTYNPWGIKAAQNETDFFSGYVDFSGNTVPSHWLAGIYLPCP